MYPKLTTCEPKQGKQAAAGGLADGGLAVWPFGGGLDTLRDGKASRTVFCGLKPVPLMDLVIRKFFFFPTGHFIEAETFEMLIMQAYSNV